MAERGRHDESAALVAPTSGERAPDMRRTGGPMGRPGPSGRPGRPHFSPLGTPKGNSEFQRKQQHGSSNTLTVGRHRSGSSLVGARKRKLRERSASITSDYFSSSAQESPISKASAVVIYENPACANWSMLRPQQEVAHQQEQQASSGLGGGVGPSSWSSYGRLKAGGRPQSETESGPIQHQLNSPERIYLAAQEAPPPRRTLASAGRPSEDKNNVYYYATPTGVRAMLGSQASSQRTYETTCDEQSPSNLDYGYSGAAERHLYAALAGPHTNQPAAPGDQWRPPAYCLDQKLVHSEPLIRSSSWQNRTLIDRQRLELATHQPQLHYLESSLVHKTLPAFQPLHQDHHLGLHALVAKMNEPPCCSGSSSDSPLAPRRLEPPWPSAKSHWRLRSWTLTALLLLLVGLLASSLLLLIAPVPFNYQPAKPGQLAGADQHDLEPAPPQLLAPVSLSPFTPAEPTGGGPDWPSSAVGHEDDNGDDLVETRPSPIEASTQPYWRSNELDAGCLLPGDRFACNQRGHCTSGLACACLATFSGPTCDQATCAQGCSQHGQCKLRPDSTLNRLGAGLPDPNRHAHLESLSFVSLASSRARNSHCPSRDESERNSSWARLSAPDRPAAFDHRLEWACECAAGFGGPDCSQLRELRCDDAKDDDEDGLIDCEDDDCCSHPTCRDNLMCFQSVEPARVLARPDLRQPDPALVHRFFARHAFLIANDSVQSYADERAFEPARVAVVRGRVARLGEPERGIVSVRVSVAETGQGFTLTRSDGFFDLLVNGNDWITLQFHRGGYVPIKRRFWARALTINSVPEAILMWLPGLEPAHTPHTDPRPLPANAFNLQLRIEAHRLASLSSRRDDEHHRLSLQNCLLQQFQAYDRPPPSQLAFEPLLIPTDRDDLEPGEPLRVFAMLADDAFETSLPDPLAFTYNSATFPPASSVAKPTIQVQLLPAGARPPPGLRTIIVQLDIEGQAKREQFEPEPGLVYHFAWNRRNIYEQKVYGFGQLNLRIGYHFQWISTSEGREQPAAVLTRCLGPEVDQSLLQTILERLQQSRQTSTEANSRQRIIWFERQVFMEANQVNQLADVGRWGLPRLNRLDTERNLVYMGAGWTLPYKLVYPPVLGPTLRLAERSNAGQVGSRILAHEARQDEPATTGRLMGLGPGGSLFLIQLGAARSLASARLIQLESVATRRHILDLPLSILASKLGFASQVGELSLAQDDIQLLYNNYASALYLSSRSTAKIVQVSYASLLVLNKTLAGSSSTAPAEDEIDIEPLCGFGRQQLSPTDWARPGRLVRLAGPHSMALDEQRQLLYFIDGASSLLAHDLSSSLVSLLLGSGAQDRPARKPANGRRPGGCRRADRVVEQPTAGSWWPTRMHALVWNRADSSLYFVDENIVFALRQDMSLEMVAFGANSAPFACSAEVRLGVVKTISSDPANGDILVLHQWTDSIVEQPDVQPKVAGKLYLAKLVATLRSSTRERSQLIDLHSARRTWDVLVARTARQPSKSGPIINWLELANPSERLPKATYVQLERAKRIPFIHLSSGLSRVDSIEVGPDGSIFVLDLGTNSIRLIDFYSPNDFGSLERRDADTSRLFGPSLPASAAQQNRKLDVLILQNPISAELIEFHSSSGLQLGLTSADDRIRADFHYQILAVNKPSDMDEDDRDDLSVKRLLSDYMTTDGDPDERQDRLASAYIRLHKISDSTRGDDYEFIRAFTGSKYVIQSIKHGNQLHAELTTDYLGVLSSYRLLKGDETQLVVEIVYDSLTYLLRDLITKTTRKQNRLNQTKDQALIMVHGPAKAKMAPVQQMRIVYDRIFYHYCDLFIVNA